MRGRLALDLLDGAARGLVHRDGAVGVLDAVLLEDLEALFLPRAGDAEDRDLLGRVVAQLEAGLDHAAGDDVDPGVGDDRHHHGDLVDARLGEHELGQAARLLDRRVAADLAVVGGLAAVLAHGVEERERAAAGADDEPEVAVELGDVAGDAAVRLRRRPSRRRARTRWARAPRASPPRRRRAPRAASSGAARASFSMSMCASSATNEPSSSSASGLISASVMSLSTNSLARRVRIGVARVERAAGHADGGDDLLGLVVGERQQVGEVARGRRGRGGSRRPPRCRCRPCRRRASPAACARRPRRRRRSTPA